MKGFYGNCPACGHWLTWTPETGIICPMVGIDHD